MDTRQFYMGCCAHEASLSKKVIAAMPEEGLDRRPEPKARTARELIGHIIGHEQDLVELIDDGVIRGDAGLIWALGFGTVFSFNVLANVSFYKGTVFDNLDHLTNNIMLPLGGLFIAFFAGWVMCRNSTADELGGVGFMYRLWRLLARYVVPVCILFVFLKAVGLLPDLS